MVVLPGTVEKTVMTVKGRIKKPPQSFLSNFHNVSKFWVFEDSEGWFEVVKRLYMTTVFN